MPQGAGAFRALALCFWAYRNKHRFALLALITYLCTEERISVKKLISMLAALLLGGCASVTQTLTPGVYYKRDMAVCMDGVCGDGTLVAKAAVSGAQKNFKVITRAEMALYTFNSCHREVQANPKAKTVEGYFTPVAGIEDQPGCAVEFAGYDEGGQHSWGYADFQDPQTVLPHTLKCNGELIESKGVSICQSRKELVQQIIFPVPVVVAGISGCPTLAAPDRMHFEFGLGKGKCMYRFEEIAGKRQARLTTFGYESIRIGGK